MRLALLSLALPALALLAASSAEAQAFAIDSALEVRRAGVIVDNAQFVYASVADCGGEGGDDVSTPVTYDFDVTRYQTNIPVVEAWLGVNNEDCTTLTNRQPTVNGTLPPLCTLLGRIQQNSREVHFSFLATQLFHEQPLADWRTGQDPSEIKWTEAACDKVRGSPNYTVFIIPLTRATEANQGSEPIQVGALSTLRAKFTPYTVRPVAPEGVQGQSGETRLGITFDMIPSSTGLTRYRGYFDVGSGGSSDAGAAGACGSGVLEPIDGGARLPPVNEPGVRKTGEQRGTSAYLTDLEGIDLNQTVAAAAVSIDPAGNESRLSTPVCLERIETDGFLDECAADPNCDGGFDSCSLGSGRHNDATGLMLLGLALAGVMRNRRRRS